MAGNLSPRRLGSSGLFRRTAPWLVVIAILGYLFAEIPISEVKEALSPVSLPLLLGLALVSVVCILAADSFALWVAFRETLPPPVLSYPTAIRLRGASYLFTLVHYGVGQGSLVYFLRRHFGVPLGAGGASVILATGAFLLVIALMMGIGIVTGAIPEIAEMRLFGIAVIAAVPIYLLVIATQPRLLSRWQIFRGLVDAGVSGTLRVGCARTLHIAVLVAAHWLVMRLFGIDIPVQTALLRLPVVFTIAALPIAPSGLGTSQLAAIALFSQYAPGETKSEQNAAILAYSLGFQVISMGVVAIIGTISLRLLRRH